MNSNDALPTPRRIVTEPRTPKGRRARERILRGARAVFARSGYVEARMVDVAAESNMSVGGLYRYFDNKQELFRALVGDIHEDLFAASATTRRSFANDPYEALLEANTGFLSHYYQYRDVLRTFVEAAAVDDSLQQQWQEMRQRHISRFVAALHSTGGLDSLENSDLRAIVECLACATEQSAYVWFARIGATGLEKSIDEAARIVTKVWFRTVFGRPEPTSLEKPA